jgi:hypothetical protein
MRRLLWRITKPGSLEKLFGGIVVEVEKDDRDTQRRTKRKKGESA